MNPHRKRTTRLVVSLSVAVLLAAALIYTSFSASSEARTPSQLRDAPAGRAYQLTGRVVPGYHREGDVLVFRVRDRNGPASAPTVPVRSGRGARPVPPGARGDRHRPPSRRGVRGRERLARHEVPVEVQRRPG